MHVRSHVTMATKLLTERSLDSASSPPAIVDYGGGGEGGGRGEVTLEYKCGVGSKAWLLTTEMFFPTTPSNSPSLSSSSLILGGHQVANGG